MYRTIPVDLAGGHAKTPLVEAGIPVEFVNVREATTGAVFSLHFGAGGEAMPAYAGDSFDTCITTGLYLSCDAQPGVTAKIFVSARGGPRDVVG